MKKLASVLEEAISLLQDSQSTAWSHLSVKKIVEKLESEIAKAKNSKPIDAELLRLLFAPTGDIQETAIENGWGDEFLRISALVDQFTIDR